MDNTLERMADTVKNKEYKDLFPETDVENAKNDEEKVKEALFQVHHMVYNEELYNEIMEKDTDDYYISIPEIREMSTEKEFNRIQKRLRGATLHQENGETQVPRTDIKDLLRPVPGVTD